MRSFESFNSTLICDFDFAFDCVSASDAFLLKFVLNISLFVSLLSFSVPLSGLVDWLNGIDRLIGEIVVVVVELQVVDIVDEAVLVVVALVLVLVVVIVAELYLSFDKTSD